MATEKGLYAKVVNIIRKDLKFFAANNNKNEAKFKFQGQSTRSQCWFDLDFDFIEVNFSTREHDLYEANFSEPLQYTRYKYIQIPSSSNRKFKTYGNFKFQKDVPMIKYCQMSLNSCCFISLASAFVSI